jgi:hypothetical protein
VICEKTGLSKADVIRRACRHSITKFLNGEIQLTDKTLRG